MVYCEIDSIDSSDNRLLNCWWVDTTDPPYRLENRATVQDFSTRLIPSSYFHLLYSPSANRGEKIRTSDLLVPNQAL